MPDGSLIPLSSPHSPAVSTSLIKDVFVEDAVSHASVKISAFLLELPAPAPSPDPAAPVSPRPVLPYDPFPPISAALKANKKAPVSLLLHHIALVFNALATERRMRHQNNIAVDLVPVCFFCGLAQDSIRHIYAECAIVKLARRRFLDSLSHSTPSPFSLAHSFLALPADASVSYSLAVLAFNFAVWRYRLPAKAARHERDPIWLAERVTELASGVLLRCRPSCVKVPVSPDDAQAAHRSLVDSLPPAALLSYTDGSASP